MAKKYVKILQDDLGVKWDTKLFSVHHIDHNRENNEPSNLIFLPKKMHHKYHMLYNLAVYDSERLLEKKFDVNIIRDFPYLNRFAEIKLELNRIFIVLCNLRYMKMIDANIDAYDFIDRNLNQLFKKYL